MESIKKMIESYESEIKQTDITSDKGLSFALIALLGELGELATIQKKKMRVKETKFAQFNTNVSEEVGDCFWYLCKICRILGNKLADIISDDAPAPVAREENGVSIYLELVSELGKIATVKNENDISEEEKQKIICGIKEIFKLLYQIVEINCKGDLKTVLQDNKDKVRARYWNKGIFVSAVKDCGNFPKWQTLRENMEIELVPVPKSKKIAIIWNEVRYGDLLEDNKEEEDGYRFHDVYHFGFYAFLGWSPVTRSLLKMKRKNDDKIDNNEDGARAILVEEGIVHFIFNYCKQNKFEFESDSRVDTNLLKTIKFMTQGFEVENVEMKLWEKAIIEATKAFKLFKKNKGGTLILKRSPKPSIDYKPLKNGSK